MLENTEGAVENEQSIKTGYIGYGRHKTKKKKTKKTTKNK